MAIERLDSAPVDDAQSGTRRTPRPVPGEGPANWLDPRRYELPRRLGEGGMGVVYEVFDRERQQAVALKRLPLFEPSALYRFKQEFRTLADVRHPNLVRLYELVVTEGDGAFF